MASYYPPRVATIKDLQKAFPDNVIWDAKEVDRLESVQKYVGLLHIPCSYI